MRVEGVSEQQLPGVGVALSILPATNDYIDKRANWKEETARRARAFKLEHEVKEDDID